MDLFEWLSPGAMIGLFALFVVFFIELFKGRYIWAVKPFIFTMIFLTALAGVLEARHNSKTKAEDSKTKAEAQMSAERAESQLAAARREIQAIQLDMRSSLERAQIVQQQLETAQQQTAEARAEVRATAAQLRNAENELIAAREEITRLRVEITVIRRGVERNNAQTGRMIDATRESDLNRRNEQRVAYCRNLFDNDRSMFPPNTPIPPELGGGICVCGNVALDEAQARNISCPIFRR